MDFGVTLLLSAFSFYSVPINLYFPIYLKVSGNITYNGHGLNEFVPQRTSAYVSQQDWHMAEMTVRETLEFAGRCQGVGFKYGKSSRQ